eukprot:CAMPEP_0119107250 /NCGR_PEP_ID=MMETSP1180-20130426/9597_1 /TAXON_ID=3052 ORGANISM="Chlamydomonas cf sp, Strain CCMP681" /NCGR_SAMPLE_ID=MMETSP1180 /ASSEMBLY_ACC=CAM_ASM_000741 /LENGTH=374 /DNA_ID=CAMNT_0007092711 /DNA_START=24 /DNA_END=1148 /DNA_ORIENTATION=-
MASVSVSAAHHRSFGAIRPAGARCLSVPQARVIARGLPASEAKAHAPAMHTLAAMLVLSTGLAAAPMIMPPVAWAEDTEQVEDLSNLTPAERRARVSEQRRQLLRQAREKAEAIQSPEVVDNLKSTLASKAEKAVEDGNAQRRADAEARAEALRKASVEAYNKEAAKSYKSEEKPYKATVVPPTEEDSGFKFPDIFNQSAAQEEGRPRSSKGSAESFKYTAPSLFGGQDDTPPSQATPEPAPLTPRSNRFTRAPAPEPVPAPAPVVTAAPEPAPAFSPFYRAPAPIAVQEAPAPKAPVEVRKLLEEKKVAVESQSTKRRGPLPLWLAQFLLLGMFVGVGAAATKYNKESTALLDTAGKKIVSLYQDAEAKISKQ